MKIAKILIVVLVLGMGILAQPSAFRFRPDRVAVGSVYHYVKTNVDGTQPENIALYIAANDRIEAFKYHEPGTRAGLVTADMDWSSFSANRLESWQVSAGKRDLFGTLTFDPKAETITASIPALRPEPDSIKVGRQPFHLYSFDLASLNFAFPHLVDPKGSFTIGIVDPTYQPDAPLLDYKGEVLVTFEKNEDRNGVNCRRYRAAGKGIGGEGTIWVNADAGHIEDTEFNVPNNPNWKTFKLRLLKSEKFTADRWQKLIADHFNPPTN